MVGAHILGVSEARILGRAFGTGAGRQTLNRPVNVAIEKEGNGITLPAGSIAGPVRRREKAVVCPTAQHVAAVHQEVPVQRRGVDPASIAGTKGQTRYLVLSQQGQEARIAMRRD